MILTEEQQRWCAEHNLGSGFDDDAEDRVQYKHVCEFVGGDGDAPRPILAKHMTRKKLVRVRRSRNAWARALSLSIPSRRPITIHGKDGATGEPVSTLITKGHHDMAHYWRCRDIESPQFETGFPHARGNPLCSGCCAWVGARGHSTMSGVYGGTLKYCRACCVSGANDRDYDRRLAAKKRRMQPLAYERQTSVALCRSPRLWFGSADALWPALDPDATVEERAERSKRWANITCVDCVRILRERGCP